MSAPYMRLVSQFVTVKRPPAMTGTPPRRGSPVTVLASSECSPFYPVTAEVAERTPLEPPHELLECYTQDEWREGDQVVAKDGSEYAVVSVADWPWLNQVTRHVVLRQAKR